MEDARRSDTLCLIPNVGFLSPPGGQLLHKLAEHTDVVVDADITADGKLVATGKSLYLLNANMTIHCLLGSLLKPLNSMSLLSSMRQPILAGSHDNSAKVWEIRTGHMLMSVDLPENVGQVRFCHGNRWLAVSAWTKLLYVVDVDTGTIIHQRSGGKRGGDQ